MIDYHQTAAKLFVIMEEEETEQGDDGEADSELFVESNQPKL